MKTNKYKIIIDTDPGVDDSACLIYSFFNELLEIKLITSVAGNVGIDTGTRNLLHIMEIFNVDIPVAKGASAPLCRISEGAEFIHQKEGLGGYIPPRSVSRKTSSQHAVEVIYNTIMAGDGDIIPVLLGPQTNFGLLFTKHPDVIEKIPKIVFMGGSPYGDPNYPTHISFNASFDPEAMKIVLDSGIPLIMVPSVIGRKKAHLDEEYVNRLKERGDVGKLLYYMYSLYWEPSFPDKRIATNDTCALFALTHPHLFKTKRCFVDINTDSAPGKTVITESERGNVELVTDANREEFLEVLDKELERYKDLHLNASFPNN